MQATVSKGLELFFIFVVLPISFLINYPIAIKIALVLIGFIAMLVYLKRAKLLKLMPTKGLDWPSFWKQTVGKLLIIAVVTIVYVYWIAPEKLFAVVLQKPLMWITILFVYSFFSVWPQEIVYRTFFYERYQSLFANPWLCMFINAILFSLAHIFLQSFLVQVLTFIGGLLFAYTYHKTKSTNLVTIEHAIYGNWLFTVGMGEMLAFPGV